MLATQQDANMTFCYFAIQISFRDLQMLEEAYGKAAIKKMWVYKWS
jgi:hypothetical protein